MKNKKVSFMLLTGLILLVCLPILSYSQTTDDILDTLESSISGNLFFAFTTLKSLGDGFESGAYTKKELDEMLPLIDKVLNQLQKNLENLKESLNEQRNLFIEEAVEAFELLIDMKNSLINYINQRSENSYQTFIEAQEEAWNKIKLLLTKNR